MKRHLGLLSQEVVDPGLLLPAAERRDTGRRTIGVISVLPAEAFLEVLQEALVDATLLVAPAGASAEEVDALIGNPPESEQGGESRVLIACGEAVVGRSKVDLCIAIDGGRHRVDLPPAFRTLRDEAELILSEPRLGTARALAALLERADAR